jgi:hypothetical protein
MVENKKNYNNNDNKNNNYKKDETPNKLTDNKACSFTKCCIRVSSVMLSEAVIKDFFEHADESMFNSFKTTMNQMHYAYQKWKNTTANPKT